ncbi:MAG: glycosyltransferase family 2 protein [Desulfobulbaceae bacterium]|nr:glycosyltransferase family 2 protein [Desulfobulbaceae bacterium]
MKPLVSILIPAYNAEKWLKDTILSAKNQTWSNTEIIVVDDGSTDNTSAIARLFESSTIKLLTNKHMGASAARNTAYKYAQGDYIQWLDADDLLAPDKISIQIQESILRSDPMSLFSSSFGCFYWRPSKIFFNPTLLWQDLCPVDWIYNKFLEYSWMNPAVWLINRKLSDQAGLWNENLSLDDDGEYFTRLVAKSKHVCFVEQAKSYYRLGNPASLSRSHSDDACNSLWYSIDSSIDCFLALEDSPRTRQACMRYLQDWYIYFYPEKDYLLKLVHSKAKSLGKELPNPPKLDLEYKLIYPFFGWKGVKAMMHFTSDVKLHSKILRDRLHLL